MRAPGMEGRGRPAAIAEVEPEEAQRPIPTGRLLPQGALDLTKSFQSLIGYHVGTRSSRYRLLSPFAFIFFHSAGKVPAIVSPSQGPWLFGLTVCPK